MCSIYDFLYIPKIIITLSSLAAKIQMLQKEKFIDFWSSVFFFVDLNGGCVNKQSICAKSSS